MKIVKEHLNEIKQDKESGLSAVGIGSIGIINRIKSWFKSNNLESIQYHINDNLQIVLHRPLDYFKIYDRIAPFMKFKFVTNTFFHIALEIKDVNMLQDCIREYKKRNIQQPVKFRKLINYLESINYMCISSKIQFDNDMLLILDLEKLKIFGLYFNSDNECVLRTYYCSKIWEKISPAILKKFHNLDHKYYDIINYLESCRSKH